MTWRHDHDVDVTVHFWSLTKEVHKKPSTNAYSKNAKEIMMEMHQWTSELNHPKPSWYRTQTSAFLMNTTNCCLLLIQLESINHRRKNCESRKSCLSNFKFSSEVKQYSVLCLEFS